MVIKLLEAKKVINKCVAVVHPLYDYSERDNRIKKTAHF